METRIITDSTELPREIVAIKAHHFEDIFRERWQDVWDESPLIDQDEEVLILENFGRLAGWAHFKKNVYTVKFRNFSVHPNFRGRGVAKLLMQHLEAIATAHHEHLWKSGGKPRDIGFMFLKSSVYYDSDRAGEAFAFGRFLKNSGFTAYAYNQNDVSPEEMAGIRRYNQMYPEMTAALKVFKKKIVDTGVTLKDSTKAELLRLTPEARAVVMGGLSWKVGHYAKSGRVSYRYDLCPICAYVGSSEQDSVNCKKCPIRETCFEPFRAVGRFKEDYEVSGAYFQAVKDFLLANGGS